MIAREHGASFSSELERKAESVGGEAEACVRIVGTGLGTAEAEPEDGADEGEAATCDGQDVADALARAEASLAHARAGCVVFEASAT